MPVLGKANLPTKHVHLLFYQSGQYEAYRDVLNGQAYHVHAFQELLTYLLTISTFWGCPTHSLA